MTNETYIPPSIEKIFLKNEHNCFNCHYLKMLKTSPIESVEDYKNAKVQCVSLKLDIADDRRLPITIDNLYKQIKYKKTRDCSCFCNTIDLDDLMRWQGDK